MKYLIWLVIITAIAALWYGVGYALLDVAGGIAFGVIGAVGAALILGVFDGASANSRWEERHDTNRK